MPVASTMPPIKMDVATILGNFRRWSNNTNGFNVYAIRMAKIKGIRNFWEKLKANTKATVPTVVNAHPCFNRLTRKMPAECGLPLIGSD